MTLFKLCLSDAFLPGQQIVILVFPYFHLQTFLQPFLDPGLIVCHTTLFTYILFMLTLVKSIWSSQTIMYLKGNIRI